MRLVYKRVRDQHPHLSDEDIAQRIFAAADRGEEDPDRLFHAGVGVVGPATALLQTSSTSRRDEK
jgi:hypothetical protein